MAASITRDKTRPLWSIIIWFLHHSLWSLTALDHIQVSPITVSSFFKSHHFLTCHVVFQWVLFGVLIVFLKDKFRMTSTGEWITTPLLCYFWYGFWNLRERLGFKLNDKLSKCLLPPRGRFLGNKLGISCLLSAAGVCAGDTTCYTRELWNKGILWTSNPDRASIVA